MTSFESRFPFLRISKRELKVVLALVSDIVISVGVNLKERIERVCQQAVMMAEERNLKERIESVVQGREPGGILFRGVESQREN